MDIAQRVREQPAPHVAVDMVVTVHSHHTNPIRRTLLLIHQPEVLRAFEAAEEAIAEV